MRVPIVSPRPCRVVLLAALAVPVVTTAVPAALAAEAEGRVIRVAVYPDRAEVTRAIEVDLPAGASEVRVTGLPLPIEADSLQVAGRGVPAAIGAVDLREEAREPARTPELEAAEKEVRRIEEDLAALAAEREVAKSMRTFLQSIQATTAQRAGRELGEGHADPAALQAVYSLLASRLEELALQEIERQSRERSLREELEVARARLDAVRPKGPVRFRVAAIGVETERAGRLTLELSYVTRGASWRPAYRARLDADAGTIAWIAEGVIRQRTGEDWGGVALTLSTAAPARGVDPPELPPWFLRPVEPVAKRQRGGADDRFEDIRAEGLANAPPGASMESKASLDLMESSVTLTAALSQSAYNVAFEVPGASTVPADGNEHRVRLRSDTLPAELSYKTVPSRVEAAYLVASTGAPDAYPLLSGVVRVFAGDAYLGAYPLSETGAGEELDVPFGQDNRVRVERTRLPGEREKEGLIGRDRRVTVAWRTRVENLRSRPVTILVEEQVPKSEDERIEVRIERQTTEGYAEVRDRPGILHWTLTIPPRATREVTLAYSVRYPKDLVVPGF